MGKGSWPDGVAPLDHTADVGLAAKAGSLAALFSGVAAGMRILVEGEDAAAVPATVGIAERSLEAEAGDAERLLVAWLRELLYLQQVEGLAFSAVDFEDIGETVLRARVSFRAAAAVPVREIKGVTYHGLRVEETAGSWRARVIFDV